jgi:hypothetical protein
VLTYKIIGLLLLASLISDSKALYQNQSPAESGKVEVGLYQLRVAARAGKCVVKVNGSHKGEIILAVPPPCEFVRDGTGAAQHFRYKNKKRNGGGYFDVILVVGGPLEKGRTDKLMKDGCGTQTQALSPSSRGVAAGAVGSGVIVCPSDSLDEKFFGFLAKPR